MKMTNRDLLLSVLATQSFMMKGLAYLHAKAGDQNSHDVLLEHANKTMRLVEETLNE